MHLLILILSTLAATLLLFYLSFSSLREKEKLVSLRFQYLLLSTAYIFLLGGYIVFSSEREELVARQVGLSLLLVLFPLSYTGLLLREKSLLPGKTLLVPIREIESEYFGGQREKSLEIFEREGGFPRDALERYLRTLMVENSDMDEGHLYIAALAWITQTTQLVRNYQNLFIPSPSSPLSPSH